MVAMLVSLTGLPSAALAGNIALTGHDDDLHRSPAARAQLNGMATFARAGSTLPVLSFDHGTELTSALTALGIPFTNVDPNVGTPAAALFNHSVYSAIIVASDVSCGGCDNDATSSTNLAAAKASFVSFFNAGGGIVGLAGAENTNYYGFLPLSASNPGTVLDSNGFTQTPAGVIDGIPAVNGDFPHNFFAFPGSGTDPSFHADEVYNGASRAGTLINQPFTIAAGGTVVCPPGTPGCTITPPSSDVPEPASLTLLITGVAALALARGRKAE
jgi:hypothetical protein